MALRIGNTSVGIYNEHLLPGADPSPAYLTSLFPNLITAIPAVYINGKLVDTTGHLENGTNIAFGGDSGLLSIELDQTLEEIRASIASAQSEDEFPRFTTKFVIFDRSTGLKVEFQSYFGLGSLTIRIGRAYRHRLCGLCGGYTLDSATDLRRCVFDKGTYSNFTIVDSQADEETLFNTFGTQCKCSWRPDHLRYPALRAS